MPEPSTREKFQPVKPRFEAEQVSSAKVIAWKHASDREVDDVTHRASEALDEIGQRVSAAYERVQTGIADAYERSKWKSEELARRARTRARLLVDKYPFQLIAGVAALALVAGIFFRVRRSNSYE